MQRCAACPHLQRGGGVDAHGLLQPVAELGHGGVDVGEELGGVGQHGAGGAAHAVGLRVAGDQHGVVVGEALQAVEGVERLAALQDGHRRLHQVGKDQRLVALLRLALDRIHRLLALRQRACLPVFWGGRGGQCAMRDDASRLSRPVTDSRMEPYGGAQCRVGAGASAHHVELANVVAAATKKTLVETQAMSR